MAAAVGLLNFKQSPYLAIFNPQNTFMILIKKNNLKIMRSFYPLSLSLLTLHFTKNSQRLQTTSLFFWG